MNEEVSELMSAEETGAEQGAQQAALPGTLPDEAARLALIEAVVYVAEEPLQAQQISEGLGLPLDVVQADIVKLIESYKNPARGVEIRQVAGGCKMFTKAEHHDVVRGFVKSLQSKVRLSLPALETLSVIAYKQPITLPEIQAIRGVNAGGVVHTLLKHKLVATAGRKKVVGKPMQYKTTRDFLVQFGLDNLAELPNLKELEELSRAALGEDADDQPQPNLPGVDEAQSADADEAEFVDQADGAEGEQE
ncbi:MAG: SMC-Scp complex subunit ScpB [Acidobacteria bacterium]|nr:SMC-Scp complex subunit ScpB [Acidobacteriota bacterium]MDA1233271.1 SMC-Scp complex subunit ScpB [Acidobacteriota bacterium]